MAKRTLFRNLPVNPMKYSGEDQNLNLAKAYRNDVAYYFKSNLDLTIAPGQLNTIPTGIRLQLPDEYYAKITPRSGLAKNFGITLLNSPGLIETGYRTEIKVRIINHGKKEYHVKKYDKIAQIKFLKKTNSNLIEGEQIQQNTERAEKGFGSSELTQNEPQKQI